ncbi:hypothetical protein QA649_02440 [Bradyrhizobium sp. CB1717]|uniref:hypothetical protein n=1 Tax=Bradyrhizobium sp. CB1717 TaxID=3039154 RepID=UPI0024B155BC|nr:hypothetical protein [Bradyrhizobium sp. CB1717]WFU25128.1 hypothetical protein QA649_02440 [Bradyrhizobium sp. CB1717]
MDTEFTRKELYDLVWSQPMRTMAASLGISDVALAKHCKKADIPVPERGYWARKQAGKPTVQIALPPRFPGASDRVGASPGNNNWGSDWAEKFEEVAIPPVPTFDEDMPSVQQRVRKLVGQVRCRRAFAPAHPLVAKLLSHDDERRKDFTKWRSDYYAPRYDAGIERRRLLMINALFLAAARLGCRPSMSTSKYGQDASSERDICITIGRSHVHFTIEPIKSRKEGQKERLRLAFGTARVRANANKFWEDGDESPLEDQLTGIFVEMLVSAEVSYRNGLIRHREWVIGRKADAEAELKRRRDEAERRARELKERLERERIRRLLFQAKALDRANQIRTYVESARLRFAEVAMTEAEFEKWASWALQEADRIDPLKNGAIAQALEEPCHGS